MVWFHLQCHPPGTFRPSPFTSLRKKKDLKQLASLQAHRANLKNKLVLFSHPLLPTDFCRSYKEAPLLPHPGTWNQLTLRCLTQSLQQKSSCCFLMCCSRSAKVLNGFTSGHREHSCCSSFLRDKKDFLRIIPFPLSHLIPLSKNKCSASGRRLHFYSSLSNL